MIVLPASTGLGEAEFVTIICACAVVPTSVTAMAVLFAELGSFTDELTVAVLVMMVPFAVPEFTFTTIVRLAAVLAAMVNALQTMLPVPPAPCEMQFHPAGAVIEAIVVFAGTASTSVTLSAALGPLLVTTCA